MAAIHLDKITKTYPDGFTAVHELDLDIADGEFVVLVGPSGCGKTTTLRMVAGLESITAGTLRIGDRVVNDVHPKDRDIAMVFQNYALYPHMTVADNMGFALRMRKTPKGERDARVKEAAGMLGITDILGKKPGQLSGGQRQRVALGRAIVRQPAVFLFDEPLSNLDPDRRVATRAEIRRIQKSLGTTAIYVTHDHEEAMALGDKIVVLDQGVLQQAGRPGEVYDKPSNLFVGRFLGSPRMNEIPATITLADGRAFAVVSSTGGKVRVPLKEQATLAGLCEGDRVTLGVRPHGIGVGDFAPGDGVFEGVVQDVEQLGFASDISVDIGDRMLQIRASGAASLRLNDPVRLSLTDAVVHVFVN